MPPLSTGASDASNLNQINNTMRDIKQKQITDIRKDDAGTRRVLFGKGADGFYGLKVSREGTDVYTATNDQLVFNSDQNVFKILYTGSVSLAAETIPSGGVGGFASLNVTRSFYAHNLGFKPAVFAYVEFTNGVRAELPYSATDAFTSATAAWSHYIPCVTNTNFFINIRGMSYGTSVTTVAGTVKFYLLQESAE